MCKRYIVLIGSKKRIVFPKGSLSAVLRAQNNWQCYIEKSSVNCGHAGCVTEKSYLNAPLEADPSCSVPKVLCTIHFPSPSCQLWILNGSASWALGISVLGALELLLVMQPAGPSPQGSFTLPPPPLSPIYHCWQYWGLRTTDRLHVKQTVQCDSQIESYITMNMCES